LHGITPISSMYVSIILSLFLISSDYLWFLLFNWHPLKCENWMDENQVKAGMIDKRQEMII